MQKKIIAFSLLILAFISVAYAQPSLQSEFEISINSTKGVIFEDEVAEYALTITNNGIFEESFVSPYTSDASWIITTDPLVFKVPPKSSETFKLFVDPKTNVAPGQYAVTLNLRSSLTDETEKALFLIFIKPLNPLPQGYRASIALNAEIDTEIDPREEIPVSVYLRNRNAKDFKNLTIRMRSKLINKDYALPFGPLEERTEKFSFLLSLFEPPQEDTLYVYLLDGEEVVNQIKIPIRVIAYSELKEEKNIAESFLKTKTTITITNFGNIRNTQPYKYPVGFFENIFTSSESESYSSYDSQRYKVFPISLEPSGKTMIIITTNYRYIIYTLLTILIIIILYYQIRSPLISKKESITSEPTHEGVSEFKIRLMVKNRSQKPIENCKIIESVPSLAKIVKESMAGTIEPTKVIKHDKRGTIIRWDINYLEPFEERIITYKIKSKLNIVGGLTLPPTKIKFETIHGRERVTYSKKHRIKIYS